jgi:CRP/FNR family cyclic AMP-dependent transcriptional regulator
MATMMIERAASQTGCAAATVQQAPTCIDAANRLIAGNAASGHLSEQDRLELMRRSAIRSLREREYLFRCGDTGRTVFVVLAGYVKLSSLSASGREVVLEIVRPGGCFGEMAVLYDLPRAADATAISACRLLAIDGRQFMRVMGRRLEGLQAML